MEPKCFHRPLNPVTPSNTLSTPPLSELCTALYQAELRLGVALRSSIASKDSLAMTSARVRSNGSVISWLPFLGVAHTKAAAYVQVAARKAAGTNCVRGRLCSARGSVVAAILRCRERLAERVV